MYIDRLSRLLHAHIAYEKVIAKITAEFCQISHYLARFDTVEFHRLLCQNDMICHHEVCAYRFLFQLTMFEMLIVIGLSRLLHVNIAYEIVI